MTGAEYVVPPVLRSARFVPRQPGSRRPAMVTAGAFTAAGLPVPEDRRRWNAYRLSEDRGWAWTPGIDRRIARGGGELLGHGALVLVDIDVPAAVDGSPLTNSFRWLSDRAVEAGQSFDLYVGLAVRTPGHPDSGHLPGWHLWFRADPDHPVQMGPMPRCRSVELRGRGTCPGSPGYVVHHAPDDLPALPRWIAELAAPLRTALPSLVGGRRTGRSLPRFSGALATLLQAERGERNSLTFWAARIAGDAGIDPAAAEIALLEAAERIGLVGEDGENAVRATIRSGLSAGAGHGARHG